MNDNESPQCVASTPPHHPPQQPTHVHTKWCLAQVTESYNMSLHCSSFQEPQWGSVRLVFAKNGFQGTWQSCYSVMSGEPSPHFSIIPTLMCNHIKRDPHVNNHHLPHHFNFTGSNVATEDLSLLQRVNSWRRRPSFIRKVAPIYQNIRRFVSDDSRFHCWGSFSFLDKGDCKYRYYIILYYFTLFYSSWKFGITELRTSAM